MVAALITVLCLISPESPATARWPVDGTGVRSQPDTRSIAVNPEVIPDGSGGAIVAWQEMRNGGKWDVYAQRVDSDGETLWKTDGIGVRSGSGTPDNAFNVKLIPNGKGGAILAWQDHRSGKWDVYAQKIDSSGRSLWTADGVGVRSLPSSSGDASYPEMADDGYGGAIITWYDKRSGGKADIYAQRVDTAGKTKWATDGVGIRSQPGSSGDAQYPQIVPSVSGGAIITWQDYRSGNKWQIFAQRVSSSGKKLWATDGVGIRSQPGTAIDATLPRIASDGSGGGVITWQDFRKAGKYQVFAQRVDSNGKRRWTTDGVGVRALSSTPDYATGPCIAEGKSGASLITWQDHRSGSKWDIFAQSLDPQGKPLWPVDGILLSAGPSVPGDAQNPQVAPDGSGGLIVSWQDYRSGKKYDIYAQRVDADGNPLWTAGGFGVRTLPGSDEDSGNSQISSDGSGGALVTWMDHRSEKKWDIYAQRVMAFSSSFYFAEGYTGRDFQEYLCLGNPGDGDATAQVTYMFGDGTSKQEDCVVPARSRSTINVNDAVGPDREVSIKVLSQAPDLVAERPMYFNYSGKWSGGSDAIGARWPAKQWYFAEGTTLSNFDQYVTVLNPGPSTARVTFHYMVEGEGKRDVKGSVAPYSRATFKTRDQVGEGENLSLHLESNRDVVAERPIYFDYAGLAASHWSGGHDILGENAPSNRRYFAEGTTRPGFEEWLCLQNPGEKSIKVRATYMLGPGQGAAIKKTYAIHPSQRLTVSVNREIGVGKDASVLLEADSGFVAERPMYFNYRTQWDGGHDSIGVHSASKRLFFAEGTTRSGFNEYICLLNISGNVAYTRLIYMLASGKTEEIEYELAPSSRTTIDVSTQVQAESDVSILVDSSEPLVAERPEYFDFKGTWSGGHNAPGFVLTQ